ncbi:tetratricopeptide repeat protein [Novosphingobium sp. ZN18A2]|uniref:tetratricopeptide repeat protein n=1 Tax=Novosphingobium sp. ZN18A2 TaxID=3079861 RepID=UPI0030CD3DA7
MSEPTPTPAASGAGGGSLAGRILLGLAAVVAVVAAGIAINRGSSSEAPPPPPPADTASASAQPSVDEVIAKLEAKLKDNPDDAEGWRMLGWSYFQTEQYAEAATALKRSTTLDPDNAQTFSFLGESLVLASKEEGKIPADAMRAFNRALKLDPKDARARYFKAVAMDLKGQHRKAIDAWFALLKDTPEDAPYAQDIRDVIETVAKKNDIDVSKRLAETQFAAPKGGMVTDGAEKASAAIPGPSRDEMQAAAQLPKGQQDAMVHGMVDGLEAKLKANPDNADGWIMLMRSRMQLGETGKAAQALKDALAAFRNDTAQTRRIKEAGQSLGVPGA